MIETASAPYVGQPATIHLFSDSLAAVVVKVNKKSIVVRRVAVGPVESADIDGSGFPIESAEGIVNEPIGAPERFSIVQTSSGIRYGAGSIRVSLGRSIQFRDYRY